MTEPQDDPLGGDERNHIRQKVMERAGIGLYGCAPDGTIEFMDRGAWRVLELEEQFSDPRGAVGKNITDLMKCGAISGSLGGEIPNEGGICRQESRCTTLRSALSPTLCPAPPPSPCSRR